MKPEIETIIRTAARATGVDEEMLIRFAEIESSGNPAARSPGGTYLGLFQLSAEEFDEFGDGDIFDAEDNALAAAAKIAGEARRFKAATGETPGAFELYMIHQQGLAGFNALRRAAIITPAWRAVRPFYKDDATAQKAIHGNLPGRWSDADANTLTAARFLDLWRTRVEEPSDDYPASDAPWLDLARAELGVSEASGAADNARVVGYYRDAGHAEVKHDDVAWCAAFVGAMLKRAGVAPSGSLMARSYLRWGASLNEPQVGCIAVLWRGDPQSTAGHVGFVVRYTATEVVLLGGNQGDRVSEAAFPRSRVLDWRWPSTAPQVKPKGQDMNEKIAQFADAFGDLLPVLARALGSPARGAVAALVVDALRQSGKQAADEDPVTALNRLGLVEALPILRVAQEMLQVVGVVAAPSPLPAVVPPPPVATVEPAAPSSAPAAPVATVEPTPDPVPAFGSWLVGYRTYLAIVLAVVWNAVAVLGYAPALLTPEVVAAGNTILAGLGGAALISKIERYVQIAGGVLKKK